MLGDAQQQPRSPNLDSERKELMALIIWAGQLENASSRMAPFGKPNTMADGLGGFCFLPKANAPFHLFRSTSFDISIRSSHWPVIDSPINFRNLEIAKWNGLKENFFLKDFGNPTVTKKKKLEPAFDRFEFVL